MVAARTRRHRVRHPQRPGCKHIREGKGLTLASNDTQVHALGIDDDGHHYVELAITSGSAELAVDAPVGSIEAETMDCDRGSRSLACRFEGEAGGHVTVTLRTSTSAARILLSTDLNLDDR